MRILKKKNKNKYDKINELPLIPLREMVVFPEMLKTFYVGRVQSTNALHISKENYNNMVFLVTQKNPLIDSPTIDDIYKTGVIAEIIEVRKSHKKNITKILIQAKTRANIVEIIDEKDCRKAIFENIKTKELSDFTEDSPQLEVLIKYVINDFKKLSKLINIPLESLKQISNADSIEQMINLVIPYLKANIEEQAKILTEEDVFERLKFLSQLILSNIEFVEIEKKINGEIRKKMSKSQRNFLLNEQIKQMQKELGGEGNDTDIYSPENFKKKLDEIGAPNFVKEKALKERGRLSKLPPISPEAGIIQTYLDWLLELPWAKHTEDVKDLVMARKILDEDHYSLKKVKNRILEFLAVLQLNPTTKGPILCFVGPPGTGKTSLGKSVARAINRKFVRMSLGGVRDEAEIRGHRRTYLGALPGKIIQYMKKVGTINPVFLLDEIDKMSSDFRGDPASALLEVLDPEQNNQFTDHYLEVPYNLSEVMFITTANSMQGIPYPLLDRMEIINIEGYTEIEKLNIAKKFLVPKEKEQNGISNIDLIISNKSILEIIRSYTMEAGVRTLQRQIASICRKIAKKIVVSNKKIEKVIVNIRNLHKFLGKKKYVRSKIDTVLDIGVSHGLAWSEVGGSVLPIEVVLCPGSGKLLLTGKLGEVMKESAQTALSYIRSNSDQFDIKYEEFYKNYDIHMHFPEGAIPKDGPSAGIAITSAILSALTKEPIKSTVAMTGEITLTGKVLPIGGLKQKALAAARHNKEIIVLPTDNEKDIEDLPKAIQEKINFVLVDKANEVFKLVFNESIYKPVKNSITDIDREDQGENFDNIVTQ